MTPELREDDPMLKLREARGLLAELSGWLEAWSLEAMDAHPFDIAAALERQRGTIDAFLKGVRS